MRYDSLGLARAQFLKVLADFWAERDSAVNSAQEIFGQRFVKEMSLVGYYIVKYCDDLAFL